MMDIEMRDRDGETPLNLAVKNRETKIEIIKLLVTEEDDENYLYWDNHQPRSTYTNDAGIPLLHQAVVSNRLGVLKLLVSDFELNIEVTDEDGNTWLHVAANHQVDDSVMDYILSRPFNCEVDQENAEGKSALIIALYGNNEEYSFRLVKKLLPRLTSHVYYRIPNPSDILKPVFIAIQQSLDRNGDPQKWCRCFMEVGGYFCNRRNQKHQMLMFFLENYKPSQEESSDEWNNLLYCSIQLVLHHKVWPKVDMREDWMSEEWKFDCDWDEMITENDVLPFILRKGINSDAHLEFALVFCKQSEYNANFTQDALLKMMFYWLSTDHNRSVDHLERITKLLEFFRTNGLNFDTMFSGQVYQTWNSSTRAVLRMLAPFCLELQMASFDSDDLTNEYLTTMVEIAEATRNDGNAIIPPIPSTIVASLKYQSRKAILWTHEDKLHQYLENVARLELPQDMVDYLLFKPTRNDYLKIFN
jgi:hypothetical protein